MESEDPGHSRSGFFRVTLRVPLKDVDPFQVVWYGNYLAYFDVARTALLRRYGLGPSDMAPLGFYAPVVAAEVQYHAPARYER